MKKIAFFIAFLILHNYFCLAQAGGNGNKAEVLRKAYITKELNLKPDEAKKFWPLYSTYLSELRKARKDNLNDELQFDEAALGIKKKYKGEFKKVLIDEDRVNSVFTLERNYREILQKELQKRQKMRRLAP
jgi:hypothetical protein